MYSWNEKSHFKERFASNPNKILERLKLFAIHFLHVSAAGSAIIDDMGCSDDDEDGTISFNIASDPSDLFEVTTAAAGGRLKLKG